MCISVPQLVRSEEERLRQDRSMISGANSEVRNRFHSQGLAAGASALLDAITRGKVHLAKFILDAGEYDVVNTKDFKGKSPLIRACYIKEEKTRGKAVQLLLSRGSDVNMPDDVGRTALSYACEMRCNDVIRILVKNNVDPDIADQQGNTPLIHAAKCGNDVGVEVLVKSFRRLGLNVDHVNNAGVTALIIAAQHGFVECATSLATDGRANLAVRDPKRNMTAEDWALSIGCSSHEVLPFSVRSQQKLGMKTNELQCSRFEVLHDEKKRVLAQGIHADKGIVIAETAIDKEGHCSSNQIIIDEIESFAKISRFREKRNSLPTLKLAGMIAVNSEKKSTPKINASKSTLEMRRSKVAAPVPRAKIAPLVGERSPRQQRRFQKDRHQTKKDQNLTPTKATRGCLSSQDSLTSSSSDFPADDEASSMDTCCTLLYDNPKCRSVPDIRPNVRTQRTQ